VKLLKIDFEKQGGLVPVIAQDAHTGEVLMMAYMNSLALEKSLETGYVHYWSRSRQKLWKKGETSGNLQEIEEIRVDCDGDCLLVKINQKGGAACHTGYRSCFYRKLEGNRVIVDSERVFNPEDKY
jgi:phosphoribosyl-AMP cyclohydrolase